MPLLVILQQYCFQEYWNSCPPPQLSAVRETALWENLDRILDLFNMIPIWSLWAFIAPCSSSLILQSSQILFFVLLEQTLADLIGTSPMLSTADGQGLWKFHDPSISKQSTVFIGLYNFSPWSKWVRNVMPSDFCSASCPWPSHWVALSFWEHSND